MILTKLEHVRKYGESAKKLIDFFGSDLDKEKVVAYTEKLTDAELIQILRELEALRITWTGLGILYGTEAAIRGIRSFVEDDI